jgi:hypothetical protein
VAARCAGEGWVVAEELPADAPAIAPATAVPRRRGLSTAVFKQEPPPPRIKWTRRVPHPVLIGHAASLTPY